MAEHTQPEKSYSPFDQREKLGEPPWSGPALGAWEKAHGHDVRLKCYPEFGCQVLDARTEGAVTVSPDVKAEAAQLVDAASVFWPKDRLAAVRMAKEGVAASGRLGHRSPERCRLLLEQLDVVAEMTSNGRVPTSTQDL